MGRRLLTITFTLFAGYFAYQNRFRLMNSLMRRPGLRRLVVSSLMGVPWARKKLLGSVFAGPSDWK
ncbi:hypothetical protein [Mesobacillus zeae]|uniref:Uncharacterized protein n=1 Tax=Mesobacillus zeae TaxID=1917180 RepID=A0A398B7H5_9BACI|nr:hypothetical protein [Mesobacillus zeae]RID83850.1 hypothetical protein D1970_14695 [Mesobacillus zeae]